MKTTAKDTHSQRHSNIRIRIKLLTMCYIYINISSDKSQRIKFNVNCYKEIISHVFYSVYIPREINHRIGIFMNSLDGQMKVSHLLLNTTQKFNYLTAISVQCSNCTEKST